MAPSHPPHLSWPFHIAPWEWTLSCGLLKLACAVVAVLIPEFVPHLLPPVVGWMLIAGGLFELALSWRGRESWVGRMSFLSGAITVVAGSLFASGRWDQLFPLSQFLVAWLLVRGLIALDVGVQSRTTPAANWFWLLARGAVDVGLGLLLLVGAPLTMFTIALLGETPEVVAAFCRIVAASFAMSGFSFAAIALAQRREKRRDPFLDEPRS